MSRRNRPEGTRFQKDLSWLELVGAIDARALRTIRSAARSYKSFLVVGDHLSGKNTVADAISGYLHETGKEPVILPTLEARDLRQVASSPNWKTYQGFLGRGLPVVCVVGHRGSTSDDDHHGEFERLSRGFDVVLDVRRSLSDGHRAVQRVFVRSRHGLKEAYRRPSRRPRTQRQRDAA